MDWILQNKEWVFSGIGIAVLGIIVTVIKQLFKHSEDNSNNSTVNNNITIAANTLADNHVSKREDRQTSLASVKDVIKILFIDDEKFMMVDILKAAGWVNTKRVKDVTNLEMPAILESHIIFVDINGVAKDLFKDQGIGLAGGLKKKYPDKVVIIYSAESNGDRFNKTLREVDECISKNAEPYEFVNLVEEYSKKCLHE